jgi:hypothetical protein
MVVQFHSLHAVTLIYFTWFNLLKPEYIPHGIYFLTSFQYQKEGLYFFFLNITNLFNLKNGMWCDNKVYAGISEGNKLFIQFLIQIQ